MPLLHENLNRLPGSGALCMCVCTRVVSGSTRACVSSPSLSLNGMANFGRGKGESSDLAVVKPRMMARFVNGTRSP